VKPRTKHPTLYELNTRICLTGLSQKLGRAATLADLPEAELDRLAELGFAWLWLLGVWQTGEIGPRISRELPELRRSYAEMLPDFGDDDISGSPFAIASYTVSRDFGGDGALAELRSRLQDRGIRLMLDFVPNHTAIDHPWARQHPDYYVHGSQADLEREPGNYIFVPDAGVLAHGRDPYFPGWTDTLQLNYGNDLLHAAMRSELMRIASMCDGVRCDMAMLLNPEVFEKTWRLRMNPFWPETIRRVRETHAGFVFMAEVYWDMEWNLQQQGFDYTYDKRLYDRLRSGDAGGVHAHLSASIEFQEKSVRFLENHDEPRAAVVFPDERERAAAVISYFVPGLAFFHDGQLQGRRARASVHLRRRAAEPADVGLQNFYASLLSCLRMPVLSNGGWQMLETSPGSCFAFLWTYEETKILTVVNFDGAQRQCYARVALSGRYQLKDQMNGSAPAVEGDVLQLEMPGWGYRIFQVASVSAA
jgi:glycosidase